MECATEFVYSTGNYFEFRGDDDVFVYINRKKVIDLGGLHGPQKEDIVLSNGNDKAGVPLGLTDGETYPLHIFFAERQMTGSNFRVKTNIELVTVCPIGTYKDGSSCASCPTNTVTTTTVSAGSDSIASCVCPKGSSGTTR